VGSRSYRNYSDEQLQEAVQKVASGEVKFRDAVKQYKVSTGTLVKYVRAFKQAVRNRQAESQVESQDESENSEQEGEQIVL
jgi:transposase-like protein